MFTRFLAQVPKVLTGWIPSPLRPWYCPGLPLANEFQVARFLILRGVGLCYAMAFLVLVIQGPGLIGEQGILPMGRYLEMVAQHYGSESAAFQKLPSLFWWNHSDGMLLAVGWTGLLISGAVLCGYANSVMLLVLWALQLSLVHVGQLFWGYGWETQLLETGFLAIFLAPLLDGRPFPKTRVPRIAILLFIWLIARIMLGAGLIKMRGDEVWDWDQLSALFYHFETQPIPNGFSWFFHHLPRPVLQGGVVFNHIVELFLPFALLLPRRIRNWAGFVMVLFQINLILSGNLSFLNYLTLVPCLACMDDRFYRRLLPKRWWVKIREPHPVPIEGWRAQSALGIRLGLLLLVAALSIAPVNNLFSPHQRMNSSFDPLHLVNTYGAFGSVGKVRREIIVEGTADDPRSPDAEWRAYGFYRKPGDPMRRPPFIAPYHHRLDWEIWFVGGGSVKGELWPAYLAARLLENEPAVVRLFRENPFPDQPPGAIRMRAAVYRFTTPQERAETGAWWVRDAGQVVMGPLSLGDPRFSQMLRQAGWE